MTLLRPREVCACYQISQSTLDRLARHPMPFVMTAPARELFDLMGRQSSFLYKLIFANLWCFRPALDLICKAGGGELKVIAARCVNENAPAGARHPAGAPAPGQPR